MAAASRKSTGSAEQEKVDVHVSEPIGTHDQEEAIPEATVPKLSPEQERKLWRKVDLRILPILTLMYLCSFMDRSMALFCVLLRSTHFFP